MSSLWIYFIIDQSDNNYAHCNYCVKIFFERRKIKDSHNNAMNKEASRLGQKWKKGIPIEVIPMAYKPIQKKIEVKYGGEAILRMSADKAGPLVTDNGNFLLDWVFPDAKYCWSSVHNYLKLIPGVVETGLFIDMTDECLVGDPQGKVRLLRKTEQSLEL